MVKNDPLYRRRGLAANRLLEHDPSLTAKAIAARLNLTDKQVEHALHYSRRDGIIPPGSKDKGTPHQDLCARWMALPDRDSTTIADAAQQLGTTLSILAKALQRGRQSGAVPASLKRTGGGARPGSVNPVRQKIDREYLLDEWTHLRQSGFHIEEAARRLGVSSHTLQDLTKENA